jgi:hypothetical protein
MQEHAMTKGAAMFDTIKHETMNVITMVIGLLPITGNHLPCHPAKSIEARAIVRCAGDGGVLCFSGYCHHISRDAVAQASSGSV